MTEALMNGRFSLYETPEGGFHIAYQPDGDGEEMKHLEIPAVVVRMARAGAAGKMNPMQMLRGVMNSGQA